MKPFSGYEAKKKTTREHIPAGGYVVKVLDVKEDECKWGNVLEISFDVIEGQYTGFFKADYKNNGYEDKKWRGKYRLNVPKDDGTDEDNQTKVNFNDVMYSFEDSNNKFHWDWDETKLKGLTIGALFRRKEWEINGYTGFWSECCKLIPAQDIRDGNFEIPKDKLLNNKKNNKAQELGVGGPSFEDITDTDDEFPF